MNRRAFIGSIAATAIPLPAVSSVDDVAFWQRLGEVLEWRPIRYVQNPHIQTVGQSAHHFYHAIATGSPAERFARVVEMHTQPCLNG